MATNSIRFLNLLLAALVAGTLFGIWIGYNPKNLSVSTYIEQQQAVISALNILMPLLGLITIVLTLISAFQQRQIKRVFLMLLIAAAFFIISGLVTKFGNQPINTIVMTWNKNLPPDNWVELRDKWWMYHNIRTFASFIALCLIILTNIKKEEIIRR